MAKSIYCSDMHFKVLPKLFFTTSILGDTFQKAKSAVFSLPHHPLHALHKLYLYQWLGPHNGGSVIDSQMRIPSCRCKLFIRAPFVMVLPALVLRCTISVSKVTKFVIECPPGNMLLPHCVPPNTQLRSTARPLLYFLFPNLLSSISTQVTCKFQ